MSDSTHPAGGVFLSYAREDADAARRIAEAMRASGVDVWFDQSELRGGDAWDGKIRRQIKECALFVPVITPTTNARAEGYFRLEWKLAVDRSHLMADDAPFLFPIVVGDIDDATARVPDKFRDVQWTRLRLDETPAELGARVARLLSGHVGASLDDARGRRPAAPLPRNGWQWWMIFPVAGTIMGLLFAAVPIWKSMNRPPRNSSPKAETPVVPAKPVASEADQAVARIYGLCTQLNYTRDNLAAAEDLSRRAVEQHGDSAAVWAARAFVQSSYVLRGWDNTEKRREDTQTFARRALALDPNETNAMLALATVLNAQRGYSQGEAMARRALAVRPDDYRLHTTLAGALLNQGRVEESVTVSTEAVRRFPREPLVHYSLANGYRLQGRFEEALAAYDKAIALHPFAGVFLYKALVLVTVRGDVAGGRAALDQVAAEDRGEDRPVGMAMWFGLIERRPARVHEAGATTTRTYFEDSVVPGPKAWSLALAYQLEGKQSLAHQQWEAAEAVLRQRLQGHAEASDDRARLATTLVWLGRSDEAAREIAAFESTAREQPNPRSAYLIAQYYAALGNAAKAAPWLEQAMNRHVFVSVPALRLDPQWDKLRGQPAFEALVAGARVSAASAAPALSPPAATTRASRRS